MDKMYLVETVVKVLFIFSYWLTPDYCIMIAVAACLMAVYRRLKTIEFSRAYLERFLQNQYGTNVMFILSFSSVGHSLFFYAPLVLHFLTGIAEFVSMSGDHVPMLQRFLGGYCQTVKLNRKIFLMAKAKIEIIYLPIAIILTLLNFGRLISTVVYVQYIMLRWKVSREFVDGGAELDQTVSPTISRIGLGGLYAKAKSGLSSLQQRLIGR